MRIYPALDLLDGNCVRLKQGDFSQKTVYSDNPLSVVRYLEESGAQYLHLVDLSGAALSAKRQSRLIAEIAQSSSLRVQCGGGLRSLEEVREVLALGVERVILGSLAIKKKELTLEILKRFGSERIVLALDVRIQDEGIAYVADDAWKQLTNETLDSLLEFYTQAGLKHVLCTDISRDGLQAGPNDDLYRGLQESFPGLCFQASGGVRGTEDLKRMRALGLSASIVGRAFYENPSRIKEFLSC